MRYIGCSIIVSSQIIANCCNFGACVVTSIPSLRDARYLQKVLSLAEPPIIVQIVDNINNKMLLIKSE